MVVKKWKNYILHITFSFASLHLREINKQGEKNVKEIKREKYKHRKINFLRNINLDNPYVLPGALVYRCIYLFIKYTKNENE